MILPLQNFSLIHFGVYKSNITVQSLVEMLESDITNLFLAIDVALECSPWLTMILQWDPQVKLLFWLELVCRSKCNPFGRFTTQMWPLWQGQVELLSTIPLARRSDCSEQSHSCLGEPFTCWLDQSWYPSFLYGRHVDLPVGPLNIALAIHFTDLLVRTWLLMLRTTEWF
jgi:hypothetical protein